MIVGIPTLNRYDRLESCLRSLIDSSMKVEQVYIVDNGGKMPESIGQMCEGLLPLFIYTPSKNLGVAASWNWLVDVTKRPIIICNDDIVFEVDDISRFVYRFAQSDADLFYPENINHLNVFSCFLIKPSVFEKIGPFDENFYPAYFEDNDYFRRMVLGGIKYEAVGTRLGHTPSSTIQAYSGPEMNEHHNRFRINRDYYVRKWGGMPGHETYNIPFGEKV